MCPSSRFGESTDAVHRDCDIVPNSGVSKGRHPFAPVKLGDSIVTDETLFVRITSGDDEALAVLFRRHVNSLERVALSVLGLRDQAHDAVQTVFVRLWNHRTNISVPAGVSPYLHRAVYNAARDAVRDYSREVRRRSVSASLSDLVQQQSADETLLQDEIVSTVRSAINTLPGRSGEVFRLWWGGTMTYAQIAECTGMSIKGVEQARARAIVHLRKALLGFWP